MQTQSASNASDAVIQSELARLIVRETEDENDEIASDVQYSDSDTEQKALGTNRLPRKTLTVQFFRM